MSAFWLLAILASLPRVFARCYEPSPAFPPPDYSRDSQILKETFAHVKKLLGDTSLYSQYPISSFSVQVTSSKETLFEFYHTADDRNASRHGAEVVDGNTVYRIASITKSFTTLGILQQQKAANLTLDDSVLKYIPELATNQAGSLPWKDITLHSLMSQLSGIPRECDWFDSETLSSRALTTWFSYTS